MPLSLCHVFLYFSMQATFVNPSLGSKAILLQGIDKLTHLKCACCGNALYNAFQTPHGCRLCESCVLQHLDDGETRRCPGKSDACFDEDMEIIFFKRDSCIPDLASRREVGRLLVQCPNTDCNHQCKWKDVEEHILNCDFGSEKCNSCGEDVQKKKMKNHLKNDCSQRTIACNKCKSDYIVSEEASVHFNFDNSRCCKYHSGPCPHCHQGILTVQQYAIHIKECEKKPMQCRFAHLGCTLMKSKSEIELHYINDIKDHIALLDDRVKQALAATGMGISGSAMAAQVAGATASSADVSVLNPGLSQTVEELNNKILNIHDHFKRLQINVANWAHLTMELESLAQKFGGISQLRTFLKNVEDKFHQLESRGGSSTSTAASTTDQKDILLFKQKLIDIDARFLALESTNYESCLTWKISEYTKRRRESRETRLNCLFSQPFFSKRYGHMFRARLFLNGDGPGENSHMSIYLLLLKSDYDDILDWPFSADVTFRLLDVKNSNSHVTKKVRFETTKQPQSQDDLSVYVGVTQFIKLDLLESEKYIKNDTFYLEVEVDCGPKKGKKK